VSPESIPIPPAAGEPFQPQDLVLTLLGTYVHDQTDEVWSGGLVELLGELGFSQGAARVALTRLVRRRLLARVRSGRFVHYRITPRCERLLTEGDRRIFSLGTPPDDASTWTLLWHQIPEDRRLERTRLARRLRFLGFGSVQDSVWVSPHDHSEEVARLLDELEVAGFASVFLSRVRGSAGIEALVSRAWDLADLAGRYQGFVAKFSRFERAAAARALDDAQAFLVRTRLVHLFRGFPFLDPELPDDLAPTPSLPRARDEAVAMFHSLNDHLAEPSQRHFDAATTPVAPGV
jgi:phenylacetic acid degradation operon negative regulatory protein